MASVPIAVVGASCRLPGGISTLDELWAALTGKCDLVGEVPVGRFNVDRFYDPDPDRPGKTCSIAGGFLSDLELFDAGYFAISPREAAAMDPKQRILLELAVEAVDDAGIDRTVLAGSDTAVFVGQSEMGYGLGQTLEPARIGAHAMPGGALSIAANRISYAFDLRGPSMAVDTACSSALVAVHQACEALRTGGSALAIAAGASVLVNPLDFVGFAKAGMLSPTFRCRAFSAGADGYVRAEGAGLVVLKRLDDALAAGDRVHAVLTATGVNTDGRTNGLLVPSAEAQAALLRDTYARAGAGPDDVVYVEAHGTGTPVGDPIECAALGEVLGRHRAQPLPIGSVKTNLGHLESASGMAGLFKAMLVLRHGVVPASLHGLPANPDIDFDGLGLSPVHEPFAVERGVVGVNSFGFGGANAHAVLASPPETPPSMQGGGSVPLMVSARSDEALATAVDAMCERLERGSADEFYDLAYTSCLRRTPEPRRAVVFAAGPGEAAKRLRAVANGARDAAGATGVVGERNRVAFAFSGNGSQWEGMGRQLSTTEPAFRAAVVEVDAALRPRLGWSVLDELAIPLGGVSDTAIAQPLLFAVQVGLVAVLREHGVEPVVVLGHSVGEVAAAYVAGALDLDAAAEVVAERSRAQATTAGTGRMMAVGLPQARAEQMLAEFSGRLVLAAVNSDRDVTIAGDADAIEQFAQKLAADDVFARELDLDYAFHSPAMDAIEQRLRERLAAVNSGPPEIPMLSTVTGEPVRAGDLDADYWWRNVRLPVRFESTMSALEAHDVGIVVEIGPHPVLAPYLRRAGYRTPTTLARGEAGTLIGERVLAEVVVAGGQDLARHFPYRGKVCALPRYPWQRERHWLLPADLWVRTSGEGRLDHPLLGERMPVVDPTWLNTVEPFRTPWLAEHRVEATVVMPATGYVEMALAAGRRALGGPVELDGLDILGAMVLSWGSAMDHRTQVSVSGEDGLLNVSSRPGDVAWTTHARGRVRPMVAESPSRVCEPGTPAEVVGHEQLYEVCDRAGLAYGPLFRGLRGLRVRGGEVWADYDFSGSQDGYEVHPALLDLAMQAGIPLLRLDEPGARGYLPSAVERVRVWRQPPPTGRVRVVLRSHGRRESVWDIVVADDSGDVAVEITGCRMRSFGKVLVPGPPRWETVMRAAPRPGTTAAVPAAGTRVARSSVPGSRSRQRDLLLMAGGCAIVDTARSLLPDRDTFTTDDLIRAGVREEYRRLVRRLLSMAIAHGWLAEDGADTWRLVAAPDLPAVYRKLVDQPDLAVASAHILSCTRRLTDMLCGREDALEVVYGDTDSIAYFHDLAPLTQFVNVVLRDTARAIASIWPADRPLRVLEVGAGTGGATGFVLPELPPDRTRYVFSDLSSAFFQAAHARFDHLGFVECQALDINADPVEQGFTEGEFDLVIASNSLHASPNAEQALRNVSRLLAPGGSLLAGESHDPDTLALPFGLLKGFWAADDDPLRADSQLLALDQWTTLLTDTGFTDVDAVLDDQNTGFSVISARSARSPQVEHRQPVSAVTDAHWLVVMDQTADRERADAVLAALRDVGTATDHVVAGLPLPAGEIDGVVFVLGGNPSDLADATTRRAAVLRQVADLAARRPLLRLALVTRPSGVLPAPERAEEPGDAPMWGAARSLANEVPSLHVTRISWDHGTNPTADARRVVTELLDPTGEDEVLLTAGGRFVPRVIKYSPVAFEPAAGFRLSISEPGLSVRFGWEEHPPPEPGPGQVVVEVGAAALNYHDVMLATGLLAPGSDTPENTDNLALGLEFAGNVTAVGPGVETLLPGDRVFGLGQAAFASHVLASAHHLAKVPDHLAFTEATTIPVAWMTVHYGLDRLARLQPGESILVHGAAGGVGIAATEFALRRGATVLATAGTELKRDFVRALGAHHVLDSRSTRFAGEVMAITGGRGVDVVLNSLGGESLARSLETLAPSGRFVEIGKRDIYANSRLAMRPLADNISLFVVDIADLPRHDPQREHQYAREMFDAACGGEFTPLPNRVYPAARIGEAFKLMQHSRHIGKIVLSFEEPVPVRPRTRRPAPDPDGTYLVVGGLGGFGAATAIRLAERGARHLVLVGRRGMDSPEARRVVDELAERGALAVVHAIDITDRHSVLSMLDTIERSGKPLRGVVHAAMVLEDRPLLEFDATAFRAALDPKLIGAQHLDELTSAANLDFFVLYSSWSALCGLMTQSNYNAGNTFLEAIARRRLREGKHGLAVAFGAIEDVGYVARENIGKRLAVLGAEPMSSCAALDAVEDLIGQPCSEVIAVGDMDAEELRISMPLLSTPRLAALTSGAAQSEDDLTALLDRIRGLPDADALPHVLDAMLVEMAAVMQTTPDRIDATKKLDELGVDSLMAIEFAGGLSKRFKFQYSTIQAFRAGGGLVALADDLHHHLKTLAEAR